MKPTLARKKKKNTKQLILLLARITLWISILCGLAVADMIFVRTYPVAKSANFMVTAKKTPVEILINKEHIDLPIIPAKFINGVFQTTEKGASYLVSSPIPGNKGNSIIYAHNWPNLFGNLSKVNKGDTVTIVFSNKTKQNFVVNTTQTVSAYEMSILQPSEDQQLTIFTCSNFLDADRFVITATAN